MTAAPCRGALYTSVFPNFLHPKLSLITMDRETQSSMRQSRGWNREIRVDWSYSFRNVLLPSIKSTESTAPSIKYVIVTIAVVAACRRIISSCARVTLREFALLWSTSKKMIIYQLKYEASVQTQARCRKKY